jgi:predicted lipoprotein with Yx(FWY)xxD motif
MRFAKLFAMAAVLMLVLAGCSDDGETPAADPTPDATTSEPTGPTATPEETESPEDEPSDDDGSGRSTEVEAEDSALGTILTDSDGNTLYVFLADTDGESTCYDECEDNWPVLEARGELEAGDGIDTALLGTTERTDGTQQVTYGGSPLYYFAGDEGAGDTNGQSVGDVWYVVGPDGEPIQR